MRAGNNGGGGREGETLKRSGAVGQGGERILQVVLRRGDCGTGLIKCEAHTMSSPDRPSSGKNFVTSLRGIGAVARVLT